MTKKIFKIIGMHCVSCSINIDGELEDTKGVKEANTNYAKAQLEVTFDENLLDDKKIIGIIKQVGYTAVPTEK
ncbi:MAG TPA: heavy-metal-associated domain-containing protein [Patescibacteria group bacterium]|nr:heavy-metal-associated domain-containing protein [Patescibacteria group bacterium]